jgi:hypothetical protein
MPHGESDGATLLEYFTDHAPAEETAMITTPTRGTTGLVPDELLALAAAHERAELERYRALAFRFLTFSSATSRLMAALGIECEMRLARLADLALRRGSPLATAEHQRAAPAWRGLIGCPAMAREALDDALVDAAASRLFYARLARLEAAAPFHDELVTLERQKSAEITILKEHCLEGVGEALRRWA